MTREEGLPERCYVAYCAQKIRGKWKILILYLVLSGENRFGRMLRSLNGVSKHILAKELRELEKDGFIHRTAYAEVPPRVEYALTCLGRSLLPVFCEMAKWGRKHQGGESA